MGLLFRFILQYEVLGSLLWVDRGFGRRVRKMAGDSGGSTSRYHYSPQGGISRESIRTAHSGHTDATHSVDGEVFPAPSGTIRQPFCGFTLLPDTHSLLLG
jgi:hypothetical protein